MIAGRFDSDVSAHQAHALADDRKPNAGSGKRRFSMKALEHIENLLVEFRSDADAIVGDPYDDVIPFLA